MKKKILSIIFAICLILPCGFIFSACDNNPTEPIMHTVTFVYNNGTENSTIQVEEGKFITKPTDPNKTGYTFEGWYVDDFKWDFELVAVMKDTTLTAKWIEIPTPITYTVKFMVDGVQFGETQTIESGNKVSCPETEPSKTGYTFDGWYLGDEKWSFNLMPVTQNIELTAKWTEIPATTYFAVTFNADNGTDNETIQIVSGNEVTCPETNPTKYGYTFDGWYFGEYKWNFAYNTVTEALTLKAHWIAVDYTISYELDDGTNNVGNPLTFTIEDEIELLAPIKSQYYHFAGWFKDSEYQNPITTITVGTTANLTLWAKWEQIYTWTNTTITGLTDYGKTLSSLTIPDDVTIIGENAFKDCTILEEVILPDGLITIKDWAFSSCTALKSISIPENVESLGNNTFKDCTALTSVTLSLDSKITSLGNSVFSNTALTEFTLPRSITTIDVWTFWQCNTIKTVYNYTNFDIRVGSDGYGYVAQYAETVIRYYYVTFVYNNGEQNTTVIVEDGSLLTKPEDPSKIGYTFVGWFVGDITISANEWDFETKTVPADLTITAKWSPLPYDVTFVFNNGTGTKRVNAYDYGSKITKPTDPIYTGFTLVGWYNGETIWDFENDIVTEDLELTARWTTKMVIVQFVGVRETKTITTSYGSSIDWRLIPDHDKSGYNFVCWYGFSNSESKEIEFDLDTYVATEDITFNPRFTAIEFTITYHLDSDTTNPNNPTFYTVENAVELVAPIKNQYYDFIGWFTDSEYQNQITTISANPTLPATMINYDLWPKWETIYTWTGTTITGLTDYGKTLSSLTIPDDVTVIGESAFENCSKFTSITLSSSLTAIEEKAFYSCTALQSISIPKNVESLGNNTFKDCTALTSVTFSSKCKITEINTSVFENTGLTSITVPKSITKIGAGAFGSCTNLGTITFEDGSGLTTIVASAFGGCTKLSSITLPVSVTSIGASAFYNCSSLTTVIINSANITFDENDFAFKNCSALTYFRLKAKYANVTNKDKILNNCPNLMGIIFEDYAITLKTSETQSFNVYADYYTCSESYYATETYFALPDKAYSATTQKDEFIRYLGAKAIKNMKAEVMDLAVITEIENDGVQNNDVRIIMLGSGLLKLNVGSISDNANLEYIIFDGTVNEFDCVIHYGNSFYENCPNLKAIICTNGEIPLTNP